MKKELLLEGLEFVDDELISEAAAPSVGVGHTVRVFIYRMLAAGAAVATIVFTEFLMFTGHDRKPSDGGDKDNNIVISTTIPPTVSQQSGTVASSATAPQTTTTTTASVADTSASTTAFTASSTTAVPVYVMGEVVLDDYEETAENIPSIEENEFISVTAPAPQNSAVTESVGENKITASSEVSYYKEEAHTDIASVEYSTYQNMTNNVWFELEQPTDVLLGLIESLGSDSEVYCGLATVEDDWIYLRINYIDGTSIQYELFDTELLKVVMKDGGIRIFPEEITRDGAAQFILATESDGDSAFIRDISGNGKRLRELLAEIMS